MPSSVFRCISVFQVYFGVYTDRLIIGSGSQSLTQSRHLGPDAFFSRKFNT